MLSLAFDGFTTETVAKTRLVKAQATWISIIIKSILHVLHVIIRFVLNFLAGDFGGFILTIL